MKSQRSPFNFFMHSEGKMRMLIPFLIILGIALLTVYIQNKVVFKMQWDPGYLPTTEELAEQLNLMRVKALIISGGGVVCMGLITVCFWMIYSHRIFGPMVQIRRHVESLCNGQYGSRIHLRRHDEFLELGDDLNRLAVTLEEKKNEKTWPT